MMTRVGRTADFHSRTRKVVESFLQTVVVLDDLAEMRPSGDGRIRRAPTGQLVAPDYAESPAPSGASARTDVLGVRLDADAVINGFADIGSVCAVLNPSPSDEFCERTVKAARRADIVILDWKIHGSSGDKALDVMREILREDQQRLRLIAIYTGEPDLQGIFDRIQGVLAEFYGDDEPEVTDCLQISKGPLRVVVLAKKVRLSNHRPELQNQEVAEHQLADRLVDEFTLMTGGLVRNFAIAGIAAIRDNAHRILAKCERSLDPAYLGHRILLHYPPDAEEHLIEALSSELTSILEENRSGACADVDAIESWLELREREGLRLSEPFPFEATQNAVKVWRGLLLQGIDAPRPGSTSKSSLKKHATEPFAEDREAARQSNRCFAALLSLKTRYPGQPPRLSIGTILCAQKGDAHQYFLCLQPKCDSVRLSASTGFPFIPLLSLEDVQIGSDGTSVSLVVETGNDQWEDFGIQPKPSELSVRFFVPGPNPRE